MSLQGESVHIFVSQIKSKMMRSGRRRPRSLWGERQTDSYSPQYRVRKNYLKAVTIKFTHLRAIDSTTPGSVRAGKTNNFLLTMHCFSFAGPAHCSRRRPRTSPSASSTPGPARCSGRATVTGALRRARSGAETQQ